MVETPAAAFLPSAGIEIVIEGVPDAEVEIHRVTASALTTAHWRLSGAKDSSQ